MRRMIANIFWLGTKELRAFGHDLVLVAFVALGVFLLHHQHWHEATCRSCMRPRSVSLTRIDRSCRVVLPRPFCRLTLRRRSRSPGLTSNA